MIESKKAPKEIKTSCPDVRQSLEEFEKFKEAGVLESLGIEILECECTKVVGRMPVDERTRQPLGILHGGASVCLAESLCSLGAWLNIDHQTSSVVGLEINANHLGMLREGFVTATATPVHIGKRTQVWQTEITSDSGQAICSSRMTLLTLSSDHSTALPPRDS